MSKIEWTEKTWNPVTGCTKISEGCQNCYAEKMHKRLQAMGQDKYRYPFSVISTREKDLYDNYEDPDLIPSIKNFGKKPKMIFVNSMSDLFHEKVCSDFICDVLLVIAQNPVHTFQILTKRSGRLLTNWNFEDYTNLWLGVTVELSKYKHRIDDLRQTNAKIKFLSCEPLLGDLGELDLSGIDWVIVGGESGPGARPMHPDWVRNIQRQCQEQNVKFFFKQWGEWCSINQCQVTRGGFVQGIGFQFPCGQYVYKAGKKKAGCLLDGKEYKEYPNVSC